MSDCAAERAGRGMFFENDMIPLHLNFDRILYTEFECTAHLGGQNDTPEIIDFADAAARFLIQVVTLL